MKCMMLYTFVKKDGVCQRIGGESSVSEELQKVFMVWSEQGYEPCDASEWDQQLLKPLAKGEIGSVSEMPTQS